MVTSRRMIHGGQRRPRPKDACSSSTVEGEMPRWARCIGHQGVAFRRSPNLADRQVAFAGPGWNDFLQVEAVEGEWLRCKHGWLPLVVSGQRVFELLDPSQVLRAKCISPQGVAYRHSANFADRNRDIAGPMFQEIVAVQERIGDWIHCEKGWLPLCIGAQPVFELFATLPNPEEAPHDAPEGPAWQCGRGSGWIWFSVCTFGRWSYMLVNRCPTLAVCLASITCSSVWVTLQLTRTLARGWWFPWFPLRR